MLYFDNNKRWQNLKQELRSRWDGRPWPQ